MLEYLDGFDHYTTTVTQKWEGIGGAYTSIAGRFGGLAYESSSASAQITKIVAAISTRIIGFAFRIKTGLVARTLMELLDAPTLQLDLRMDATGHLFVTRNGTTVGSVAASALAANTWYYIEWKSVIDNAAGSFDVHVDGVSVVSGSGLDTQNTANASANRVRTGVGSAGNASNFDDVYVLDTTGSLNNDFLGECRIITSMPTADGSTSVWTPSTGTASWSLLDEADPNTTDYISSATVGQIDLLGMADIAPTGPILGVQAVFSALKDDAGLRQIAEQCKSGATTYTGAATHTLTSTYAMYRQIRETDPATGVQWSLAGFNAAEFGAKVIA